MPCTAACGFAFAGPELRNEKEMNVESEILDPRSENAEQTASEAAGGVQDASTTLPEDVLILVPAAVPV